MSPEMLEKVRKDSSELPEKQRKCTCTDHHCFEKHVPVLQEKVWLKMKLAKAGAAMTWDCRMKPGVKGKRYGLDTLIMGIRNSEKLREYLEIPASQEVVSVIAVGYGAIKPEMPVRKNVEDIVKFF